MLWIYNQSIENKKLEVQRKFCNMVDEVPYNSSIKINI